MLPEPFDLCLEVKGDIGLRRVELTDELSKHLESVLLARLRQFVAQHLVQLRHHQTVKHVLLVAVVEAVDLGDLVASLDCCRDRLLGLSAVERPFAVSELAQQAAGALPTDTNGVNESLEVSAPLLPQPSEGLGSSAASL